MLKGNLRFILYFDLAMTPYPSDAPPIPLGELVPYLEKRCANGECTQVIDSERKVIRLSQVQKTKTSSGEPALAMLFCLGDRDKASPGFTNFETGAVRIPERKENEVGGLSVHAVVSLTPTKPKGHLYRMVYEDVTGFGRTLIQGFLRHEFKVICEDADYHFKRDEAGDPIKTRPLVELEGHASDRLKNSLKTGKLLHVELTNYVDKLDLDEDKYFRKVKRQLNLSISNQLPEGDSLTFIERVKEWGNKNGYKDMRVRWRDADLEKPQTAKINTDKQDAGEALFIKSAELNLKSNLPDISETISKELVRQMNELLE